MRLAGRAFVYERTNDLYCEVSFGKQKKKIYEYPQKLKANDVAGGVFKVTNLYGKKLLTMDKNKAFEGVKLDEIIEKYSQISGKWYSEIKFDKVVYKSL